MSYKLNFKLHYEFRNRVIFMCVRECLQDDFMLSVIPSSWMFSNIESMTQI